MTDKPDTEAAIARIATLTGAARATWLSFIGVTLFVGVTLLGIGDADFFMAERSVDLPLIGVSVPVMLFFLFGAGFVAVIHTYLHVFLEELWSAIAAAPPELGGRPLATAISPWLVNAFALRLRAILRRDEPSAINGTALGAVGSVASFAILYIAAPVLLMALWLRSQVAHEAWITVVIGLMTVSSAGVSLLSLFALHRAFVGAGPSRAAKTISATAFAIGAFAMVATSMLRTSWDPMGAGVTRYPGDSNLAVSIANWFRPAIADLSGKRLTRQSADWLPHEESLTAFAKGWCAERAAPGCKENALADPEFRDAYRDHRQRWLAIQDKPDLSGRNMNGAQMVRAFLPGVVLNGAKLRRADMSGAQMEGVTAEGADMTAAALLDVHFDFARARYAHFVSASMLDMSAVGADLAGSDFSTAYLSEVDLRYGILDEANFEAASLTEARLDHASLPRTRFNRADLRGANLTGARLHQTDFSQANLEGTRLHGAEVSSVVFEGALISWALVANHGGYSFGRTNFSGARLFGVGLRGIDASQAVFDSSDQLNWVFGDASVSLPEGVTPPCHWSRQVLDDRSFHAHWRGVVEAMSIQRRWESIVPEAFADVAAIPLPSDCTLVEFDFQAMMPRPHPLEQD